MFNLLIDVLINFTTFWILCLVA